MFITRFLSIAAAVMIPLVCLTNVVCSATPTTDGITYPTQGASFAANGETSTVTWYVTSVNGNGPQSYNLYLVQGISNTLVDNLSTGFTSDGAGENSDDWYVSTNYADGFDYKIKIVYNSTFVLYSDNFSIYGSHNDTTGLNDPRPDSSSSSTSSGDAGTVTATVTAAGSQQTQISVILNSPTTVTTSVVSIRSGSSSPSSTQTAENSTQTTSPDSISASSTSAPPVSKSSSTSTATLAGAVAGSVGGVLLLMGIIFYLVRRHCSCAVTRKERPMSTRIRSGHFPPAVAWDDRPSTAAERTLSRGRPGTAEVDGNSITRQELDSETYANEKAATAVKHVSMQEQMQRQAPRRMTERWELDGEV